MTSRSKLTSPEATAKKCPFFAKSRFFCLFHLLSLSTITCQAFHRQAYSHVAVSLPPSCLTKSPHRRPFSQYRHVTRVDVATGMLDDGDFGFADKDSGETHSIKTSSADESLTRNSWEIHFRNLERFHQEYGHANVPQHPSEEIQQKYPQLAHFCKNQRSLYKNHETEETPLSSLLQERKKRLESLGFDFDMRKCLWDAKYEKLYAFWKEHGHLKVTKPEHPDLYSWMHYQRQKYKSSKRYKKPLTPDQVERLERINFCWNPKEAEWWNNYHILKKFREQHGNWEITSDSKLRAWKNSLRRTCREYVLAVKLEGSTDGVHVSGLNEKRLEALREIRFCWLPEQKGPLKEDPPEDIFDGYQ